MIFDLKVGMNVKDQPWSRMGWSGIRMLGYTTMTYMFFVVLPDHGLQEPFQNKIKVVPVDNKYIRKHYTVCFTIFLDRQVVKSFSTLCQWNAHGF